MRNDRSFLTHIRSILKRSTKWYQAKIAMGEIKHEKYQPEPAEFENEYFKIVEKDRL